MAKQYTRNRRTQRTKRRRKDKKNNSSNTIYSLPDINNKPVQTRCIRYEGKIAAEYTFDSRDIRCFAGAVTSSSTTYYPICEAFKLRRVGLTIICDSTTSAGVVMFSWNGFNAPDVLHTMIVGPGFPNHRSYFPSEGTNASWWWDSTSSTTELFGIESNDAEIKIFLDIEIEYIIADGPVTNVALTTTAGITGYVYRTLPIGEPTFVPVGLETDT